MISQCFTDQTPLVGVLNRLRCGFARFKLRAYVLKARGKRFNLLLLACGIRFQFVHFAVLFQRLIQQRRVHRFVAHV